MRQFIDFLGYYLLGIVWCSVRNLGVLVTNVFNIANSHQMGSLQMVHGICRNLCIYAGNSGTAKPIAGTTACLLGRKKELILVISLSNTMANGHLDESMAFRFAQAVRLKSKSLPHSALLLLIFSFSIDLIQEPVAVALATLNLAVQFHGWISFFILLYYKLPLKPNKKTYYEYTGLWHIYGVLAMNSWFWNAAFHCR